MSAHGPQEGRGFSFLFRTDQGRIGRATWWRGTLPLAAVGAVATAGWIAVRPLTRDAIHQPPALAVLGYLYVVGFAFAILLLFICEYNLSAKRFADRRRPRVLAAVLPACALAAGTLAWYVPRSQGSLPDWTVWLGLAAVLGVLAWNAVELGIRKDR